ncbi:MAG: hypothetical protein LBK70_00390 [Clostridiales bacterium]|nr:hypothetical protein [Clostridiales bacterium]
MRICNLSDKKYVEQQGGWCASEGFEGDYLVPSENCYSGVPSYECGEIDAVCDNYEEVRGCHTCQLLCSNCHKQFPAIENTIKCDTEWCPYEKED